MSITSLIKQFDVLTRKQILALRPGEWSDVDLLKVLKYFDQEKNDRDRAMAVAELILRSPQMVETDYTIAVSEFKWVLPLERRFSGSAALDACPHHL